MDYIQPRMAEMEAEKEHERELLVRKSMCNKRELEELEIEESGRIKPEMMFRTYIDHYESKDDPTSTSYQNYNKAEMNRK